jgi:methylenetetrahydrofolate dehydrogenase (NADP+)/methenyltetrahydrofolate cyclohydrolase
MRFLNGAELANYIKERQAKQVRRLRQEYEIEPKLAILLTIDSPVINKYVELKKNYGADLQIEVEVIRISQADIPEIVNKLNKDPSVHGIIIQLPLEDPTETDAIVKLVDPSKDVDGLGEGPAFTPATPQAILWLLSGYNIDLPGKNILIVGRGKLVGAPLQKIFIESGLEPNMADKTTTDLKAETLEADIIISATGVPGLISSDMLKEKAVVIDAGTASEKGEITGDIAKTVYSERDDLVITPRRGGVGPLTVCALFDNVIQAAEARIIDG